MDIMEKLEILTGAAKYDVACTSSGSGRGGADGSIGNTVACGICHAFAGDGRCVSLLKVLMTNVCIYDCKYCINRRSNDPPRAAFTPRELAELTINFYRRNYIEGLFLSSGVIKSPDYAMEQMCETIALLRGEYRFGGYIHAKTIPGASPELIDRIGMLADRISVNIELPSESSLKLLAPDKGKHDIFKPMSFIQGRIKESRALLPPGGHNLPARFPADGEGDRRGAVSIPGRTFAQAGQSTQMIIGATPDSDYQIVRLSESLYQKYSLKRVFYSAYIPVGDAKLIPAGEKPQLLREHRLYQADWLLRFYGFSAEEILNENRPNLDPWLDPKCFWAVNHLERFPVEVNRADYETLLRVPGIGVTGAKRIVAARRQCRLTFDHLKKLGVVLKRAVYFITCDGKYNKGVKFDFGFIRGNLTADAMRQRGLPVYGAGERQLSISSDI